MNIDNNAVIACTHTHKPPSVSGHTSSSLPYLLFHHQDQTARIIHIEKERERGGGGGGKERGRKQEHHLKIHLTFCTLEFSGCTFLVFSSGSLVTILLHHSILFTCSHKEPGGKREKKPCFCLFCVV